MDHFSSLNDLRQVVSRYVDQYQLVPAGGPLAASAIVRTFITKNKLVSAAVAGSTVWLAVKEISGPLLGLIQDQFAQLEQILGTFR